MTVLPHMTVLLRLPLIRKLALDGLTVSLLESNQIDRL